MIERQKKAIARAKDPSLNPDERGKAGLDVALQMMGILPSTISTLRSPRPIKCLRRRRPK